MKLYDLHFNRKFSQSLYRAHSIKTGGISFAHDFTASKHGEPHPVINSNGGITEKIGSCKYTATSVAGGNRARLIGEFFPYYTYSIGIEKLRHGAVGISLIGEDISLIAKVCSDGVCAVEFQGETIGVFSTDLKPADTFEVTFRAGGISLYKKRGTGTALIGDISETDGDGKIKNLSGDGLSALLREEVFKKTDACLYINLERGGSVTLSSVDTALVGGIMQADIRPMKYEDGSVICEGGRVFLTVSERLETGCYQSVLSWSPTTADFRMEGALFFDLGDGIISNDVASSVVYDRNSHDWYIWFCAFSHGHVLARAKTKADLRYGISIIDANPVDAQENSPLTDFSGVFGDEDPDLLYKGGKWHLAVCRPEADGYHYYRFISDSPLSDFVFADRTEGTEKTGGSFVNFEGEHYFVCGSDFSKRAVYDVYKYDDFKTPYTLTERHDDGGFRGWGSVFGLNIGTRKRYFHITFDRMLGNKKWNWSYGNIYVFEAEEYFKQ